MKCCLYIKRSIIFLFHLTIKISIHYYYYHVKYNQLKFHLFPRKKKKKTILYLFLFIRNIKNIIKVGIRFWLNDFGPNEMVQDSNEEKTDIYYWKLDCIRYDFPSVWKRWIDKLLSLWQCVSTCAVTCTVFNRMSWCGLPYCKVY